MGVVYLIRHGQASFDSADYDELSDLGHQQARLTGRYFAQQGIELQQVFSGALKRQQQSANCHLEAVDQPPEIQTLAGLNEFDHEDILKVFLGLYDDPDLFEREVMQASNPRTAFQTLFEKAILRWASNEHDNEYSESWGAFNARVMTAMGQVVALGQAAKNRTGQSQNIAVFTSAGVIAALTKTLLRIPDTHSFGLNWALVNSSVTKVLFGERGMTLSSFNEQSHLQPAKTMITYR